MKHKTVNPWFLFFMVWANFCVAQSDNVIESSDDAFGNRIGEERIGLYSEGSVRGFSLQDAGNYRIEDSYFVVADGISGAVTSGSSIRVGPNALTFDYPSPSGVVQYRLLDDAEEKVQWQLGLADVLENRQRPYMRLYTTQKSEGGQFSLATGLVSFPDERYGDGSDGQYHTVGLVPRWSVNDNFKFTGFVQHTYWDAQGNTAFRPQGLNALPEVRRRFFYGQEVSRNILRSTNSGLIGIYALSPTMRLTVSSIYSYANQPQAGFDLLSGITEAGDVAGTFFVFRGRKVRSFAHEARLHKTWVSGDTQNDLDLLVRGRLSDYRNPRITQFDVGGFSLDGPAPQLVDFSLPEFDQFSSNEINQNEMGISWQHVRRSGLGLNLSLRRAWLEEVNQPLSADSVSRDSSDWLYNASIIVPIGNRLTLFSSHSRGIEQSGIAPENAANQFEVLEPVVSRQSELGIKYVTGGDLTLIATAFDLRKPDPGFNQDNVYTYISDVQHRGVEFSLGGRFNSEWSTLMGALFMQPKLSGEAVDSGLIGEHPVGRSSTLGLISLNYQKTGSKWSFDGSVNYSGSRYANGANTLKTSGYATVNLGSRYRFNLMDKNVLLRLRLSNVTDKFTWVAFSSGLQGYNGPRQLDMSLTMDF